MIRHIVLLAFKKELKERDIEAIFLALENMKNAIPQIQSFTWGKCNSPEQLNKAFTHGFCMEFIDDKAREIYLQHPLHIGLVEKHVGPALADGENSTLVFDYTL